MVSKMQRMNDIYDQAIHQFLTMVRHQFWYDVNKRMGRFMKNGLLLTEGYCQSAFNINHYRWL
jgi:prophage maintenance system killer protein